MLDGYYGNRTAQADRASTCLALTSHLTTGAMFAVTRTILPAESEDPTLLHQCDDASICTLAVRSGYKRDLYLSGRRKPISTPVPEGSFAFFDKRQNATLRLRSPSDHVQFYIPRAGLDTLAYEAGLRRVGEVRLRSGDVIADEAMRHIALAFVPAFLRRHEVSQLFVDCITRAAAWHIASFYGATKTSVVAKGGLAAWQEKRVKELLDAQSGNEISLDTLANACSLSPGHFSRAFRQTFGRTPHQWLLHARVGKAKVALRHSGSSLAEVADACGFADQSHFTRVFNRIVGTSPGHWRRENYAGPSMLGVPHQHS